MAKQECVPEGNRYDWPNKKKYALSLYMGSTSQSQPTVDQKLCFKNASVLNLYRQYRYFYSLDNIV